MPNPPMRPFIDKRCNIDLKTHKGATDHSLHSLHA